MTAGAGFRLGELFCGAGGIACGARMASKGRAPVTHAWASDIDADACATYARNICGGDASTVLCEDVRDLDIASLGPIDAFAYGFPCNSFSVAGKRKGLADAKYGDLYLYGIEVLRHFHPKWFFAENVSGLGSAGDAMRTILTDMEAAGYAVTPHKYAFERYGVPQMRHRIVIVGIRDDIHASGIRFRVPSPQPWLGCDVSAGTALAGIPAGAPNNERRDLSEKVRKRLSYVRPGQNVWQAEGIPPELQLNCMPMHSIYQKLDPQRPAYTLTAAGGGGTQGFHWSEEQRELTNRERARIQTFPDDYAFVGSRASVRKQIGMAVPPKGAAAIIGAILDTFAGVPYPATEQNIPWPA